MKRLTTAVLHKSDKWIYENATITLPKEGDAESLAPRLREADRQEIYALTGLEPEPALQSCLNCSDGECYSVRDLETDIPFALFGTSPNGEDTGYGMIWFLGSGDLFKKNKVSFLRNSEFWVQKLFENYDLLYNVVDARNTLHIRWLKWLKFKFIADIPEFGYEGRPFRQFYRRKDDDA